MKASFKISNISAPALGAKVGSVELVVEYTAEEFLKVVETMPQVYKMLVEQLKESM